MNRGSRRADASGILRKHRKDMQGHFNKNNTGYGILQEHSRHDQRSDLGAFLVLSEKPFHLRAVHQQLAIKNLCTPRALMDPSWDCPEPPKAETRQFGSPTSGF